MQEHEKSKGAFKDLPIDQQPDRIPLSDFHRVAGVIEAEFGHIGRLFIPDATKKGRHKPTTGDVDIIIQPHPGVSWCDEIRSHSKITHPRRNGGQFMAVANELLPGKRVMVDFIHARDDQDFRLKSFYHQFGKPAVVALGSFARSLGYKFGTEGLFLRQKDERGNWHNHQLTREPEEICKILDVDYAITQTDKMYYPEGVAAWIEQSSRFDSTLWRGGAQGNQTGLEVRSRSTTSAERKDSLVTETLQALDKVEGRIGVLNENHVFERRVLGNEKVEEVLALKGRVETIKRSLVTGEEVMEILGIAPGPEVGKVLKELSAHEDLQGQNATHERALEVLRNIPGKG